MFFRIVALVLGSDRRRPGQGNLSFHKICRIIRAMLSRAALIRIILSSGGFASLRGCANKNTIRLASRWCSSYCLAAPCELGSVFHYALASPSRKAGCLLSFLVDVNLTFLQSPSAQSAYHLSKSLTVDAFSVSHSNFISTPPLNFFGSISLRIRMAN